MIDIEARLIRLESKVDGLTATMDNHVKHHQIYTGILVTAVCSLIVGLLIK